MTDRIDHAAEARRLMSAVTTRDWAEESPYVDRRTAAAQVHALLALAEQQCIANLIALLKDTFASHEALEVLSDVATAQSGQLISLRPDIAAALGIETGAGDE